MIKISRTTGLGACYKINWVGQHTSDTVREGELLNALAHYYALPEHKPETCILCRRINKKMSKRTKKGDEPL